MNILTLSYNNSELFYLKPDTSLNRDYNNYFCPERIGTLLVTPFIYVRIERAGKSIMEKFAERYYNSFGEGLFIKAVKYSTGETVAPEICNLLDNSTFMSTTSTIIDKQRHTLFNSAIVKISNFVSLRRGDIIAIETGIGTKYERGENVKINKGELSFEIIF